MKPSTEIIIKKTSPKDSIYIFFAFMVICYTLVLIYGKNLPRDFFLFFFINIIFLCTTTYSHFKKDDSNVLFEINEHGLRIPVSQSLLIQWDMISDVTFENIGSKMIFTIMKIKFKRNSYDLLNLFGLSDFSVSIDTIDADPRRISRLIKALSRLSDEQMRINCINIYIKEQNELKRLYPSL